MWRRQATEWLRSVFPDSGRFEIEVHRERAWGDIWKVHADEGLHWFKAGHPALRREVRLRRVLVAQAPDLLLPTVADDADTGWMLTRDQGPTLATLAGDHGPQHYVDLAEAIARVQRSVPYSELEPLGLPIFHPDDAVAALDRALAWFAALPTSHPCHAGTRERRRALGAMDAVVSAWAAVRPDVPALAIDHNDLHAGNAYPGPRISDWGDAVVGHPFGSLRPLLLTARRAFGPELADDVRRAYLRIWGDPDDFAEALDVAIQLAVPNRLMCWHILDDPAMVADYAQYVRPLWEEVGLGVDRVSQH